MIKLSRSGIEQYLNCKRCFVLQYKHKVKLQNIPFTLNSAVDNLCKNEFDHYREKQKPHPLFIENNIEAIPFQHADIDKWRDFRKGGISFKNEKDGYHFWGAIDDVWIKANGELIISDVKCTSKNKFDWKKTWQEYEYPKGYKRQLEMYQWLFRKNGFSVTNTAYLVYYNGLKNESMFNQVLKFDLHLVELDCNSEWVEDILIAASKLMESDSYPQGSRNCDVCQYLKRRWVVNEKKV